MVALPSLNNGFGIVQQNNITIENLTRLTNFSGDPTELIGNVNQFIYNGHLFFIILCLFFIIAYGVLQSVKREPLANALKSSTFCSILGWIMRAIEINGKGLISPYHVWIFPIITALLVLILKSLEDD